MHCLKLLEDASKSAGRKAWLADHFDECVRKYDWLFLCHWTQLALRISGNKARPLLGACLCRHYSQSNAKSYYPIMVYKRYLLASVTCIPRTMLTFCCDLYNSWTNAFQTTVKYHIHIEYIGRHRRLYPLTLFSSELQDVRASLSRVTTACFSPSKENVKSSLRFLTLSFYIKADMVHSYGCRREFAFE